MTQQLREQARELTSQMTLEEKASLCSGKNFWESKAVERVARRISLRWPSRNTAPGYRAFGRRR